MRSTLIIASLALTALAVPVPQGSTSHDSREVAPIELLMDKRFQRTGDGGYNTRSEEEGLERRAIRNTGRSVEDEDELDARAIRNTGRSVEEKRTVRDHGRSVEVEDELDARAIRNTGRSVEDEDELDARAIRNTGRSVEDEDELDARAIRNTGRSVEEKRTVPTPGRSVEGSKNTIRNIYDGVVGIVEALKTRGFKSASSLPVRQPL